MSALEAINAALAGGDWEAGLVNGALVFSHRRGYTETLPCADAGLAAMADVISAHAAFKRAKLESCGHHAYALGDDDDDDELGAMEMQIAALDDLVRRLAR